MIVDRVAIFERYGRHPNDMGGAVQLAIIDARIAHLREDHIGGRHPNDHRAGATLLKLMQRRRRVIQWLDRKKSPELARYFRLAAEDPAWVVRQPRA